MGNESLSEYVQSLSPGWITDLAILKLSGSRISDCGDHLTIRTPNNPEYHWGNCLIVTDPKSVDDVERWIATFAAEFPTSSWFAVGMPRLPNNIEAWMQHGIELEELEVLSTAKVPIGKPLPHGYTVRMINGADWDQVVERDIAQNEITAEFERGSYERFVREKIAARIELCQRGLAAFFGAFSGEELVADLGIVKCENFGRFQDVSTDERHRRRGLASHLIGVAAQWSAERGCNMWVIVTEATNTAGSVYRRAGFSQDDFVVNAYRHE